MVTKEWKVYGEAGHRQKMSFENSVSWDWSNDIDGIRKFEADNFDKTGTHDYTIIRITRETEELCDREFEGQLSDGYFENAQVGDIVETSAPYHDFDIAEHSHEL